MDTQTESLAELMEQAFYLSLQIAYETITPEGHYFDTRKELQTTERNENIVWGWADGLTQRGYENVATGRCSLRRSLDFDLAKFERMVKNEISMMETLLKKLGLPRKMTKEEMRTRGYKGYDETPGNKT